VRQQIAAAILLLTWAFAMLWAVLGVRRRLQGLGQFIRDTTSRKEAERLLRESEELNRRIFDNSPDCITVLDLDGHLISMNSAGRRAMEVESLGDLTNLYWPSIWLDEEQATALKAIEQARDGEEGSFRGRCLGSKSPPKCWDVRIKAIPNAQGKAERLLAISRDITAQTLAEEAAIVAQERLELALRGAHIGAWTWDVETNTLRWHENCAAIFGLPRET
jgi:PAS domain S-box-containing protein